MEGTPLEEPQSRAPAWRWTVPPGLVAVTAILLASAAFIHLWPSGRSVIGAGFSAVLVVIAAVDLEQRRIPNVVVLPAGALVLAGNVAADSSRWREWVLAAVIAASGALVVAVVSRGGIGYGDVKLLFLLGAGLGWHVVAALAFAGVGTFVVALGILLRHGMGARKWEIPFGPFLAAGAVLTLLLS